MQWRSLEKNFGITAKIWWGTRTKDGRALREAGDGHDYLDGWKKRLGEHVAPRITGAVKEARCLPPRIIAGMPLADCERFWSAFQS